MWDSGKLVRLPVMKNSKFAKVVWSINSTISQNHIMISAAAIYTPWHWVDLFRLSTSITGCPAIKIASSLHEKTFIASAWTISNKPFSKLFIYSSLSLRLFDKHNFETYDSLLISSTKMSVPLGSSSWVTLIPRMFNSYVNVWSSSITSFSSIHSNEDLSSGSRSSRSWMFGWTPNVPFSYKREQRLPMRSFKKDLEKLTSIGIFSSVAYIYHHYISPVQGYHAH